MDAAAASVQRYMVAQNNHRGSVIQGVLTNNALQFLALKFCQNLTIRRVHANIRSHFRQQLLGHNQLMAGHLHHGINIFRMNTNRQIGRNCPGSGCPNHKTNIGVQQPFAVSHRKFHINSRAFHIGIFNLGLGQSCFTISAPVNRLFTFINVTLFYHLAKSANLLGFKFLLQGNIGVFPIRTHTQTLKLLFLRFHKTACKFLTLLTKSRLVLTMLVNAQLLDSALFNRQSVRIPTRHIRRVKTGHALIFYDNILKHLVQNMPGMNVAISIGRPVMQYKFRLAGVLSLNQLIDVFLLPK